MVDLSTKLGFLWRLPGEREARGPVAFGNASPKPATGEAIPTDFRKWNEMEKLIYEDSCPMPTVVQCREVWGRVPCCEEVLSLKLTVRP